MCNVTLLAWLVLDGSLGKERNQITHMEKKNKNDDLALEEEHFEEEKETLTIWCPSVTSKNRNTYENNVFNQKIEK